jgi:hypothetical protein
MRFDRANLSCTGALCEQWCVSNDYSNTDKDRAAQHSANLGGEVCVVAHRSTNQMQAVSLLPSHAHTLAQPLTPHRTGILRSHVAQCCVCLPPRRTGMRACMHVRPAQSDRCGVGCACHVQDTRPPSARCCVHCTALYCD